jgi:5-methyltetrahydrofolate--homocysteine methyltransferase
LPYIEAEKIRHAAANPDEKPDGKGDTAGKILMATVKGDVHDIGKNIVGVVLGCNNYEVIDLGVMVPAEKILQTAREQKVDIIGLSGLITPSLDEMVHVAKEMERQGFKIPLLIGGATTSRIHTAVKIAPNYSGAVVHVLDASRSVPVAGKLANMKSIDEFTVEIKAEYEKLRQDHASRQKDKNYISIEKARDNKTRIDWEATNITKPAFLGNKYFHDYDLAQIATYIDWTPFFQTWQLQGKYPKIFDNPIVGVEAKKLFDDANDLLQEVIEKKLLTAKAVIGFYPANAVDDDIVLYDFEEKEVEVACDKHGSHKSLNYRLKSMNGSAAKYAPEITKHAKFEIGNKIHFLRQQGQKASNLPNLSLADFVAPIETGKADYVGAFAVTAGIGIEKLIEKFERDHDDYNSIMIKAIADRLAEAFAELMHERVRKEFWGYDRQEKLSSEELIEEKYQGIRPAPGYPACPDHTEKRILFDLLDAENQVDIKLTESFAMYPASSVSGWYFSHPESKYFGLGKIAKDQVVEYAKRKNMSLEDIERWLAPNLNYD